MKTDALIHSIYEGLLEEDLWASFLHNFRLQLRSNTAMIMVDLPSDTSLDRDVDDSEWHVKTLKNLYYSEYFSLNPIDHEKMDYGKIYSIHDFISYDDFERSDYYNNHLRLSDIYYAIIAYLGEVAGVRYWLHVARGKSQGDYSAQERKMMAQLVPHVNRALRLKAALAHAETEKSVYSDALDTVKLSIVLLDRDSRILNLNERAEALLSNHPAFLISNGCLRLANATEGRNFLSLVEKVMEGANYGVMPVGESFGRPVNLLLRRFAAADGGANPNSPIAAVLYIKDPSEPHQASANAIAALYGLRPTEARLAAALAGGASIKEAAVDLGMSELTVRTYVKRILQKTGTHRQTDLVQMINSGLAVLA